MPGRYFYLAGLPGWLQSAVTKMVVKSTWLFIDPPPADANWVTGSPGVTDVTVH
jgi:hypothetical protein